MHKLKQLVDDGFEEPPVSSQEAGVLAHHVHDVRRDDGLVILASLLFTQTQKILQQYASSHNERTLNMNMN